MRNIHVMAHQLHQQPSFNNQRNERSNQAQIKAPKVYNNRFLVETYTPKTERFAAQKINWMNKNVFYIGIRSFTNKFQKSISKTVFFFFFKLGYFWGHVAMVKL